jgi:hypothetical protein
MKSRSVLFACAAVLIWGMAGCSPKGSTKKAGKDNAQTAMADGSYNFSCAEWGNDSSASDTAQVENRQMESC